MEKITAETTLVNGTDFSTEKEHAAFLSAMEKRTTSQVETAQAQADAALIAAKSLAWLGKTAPATQFLCRSQATALWQGKQELFLSFLVNGVAEIKTRNKVPHYYIKRINKSFLLRDKLGIVDCTDKATNAARERYAQSVKRAALKGQHKGESLLSLLPRLHYITEKREKPALDCQGIYDLLAGLNIAENCREKVERAMACLLD